MTTTGVLIKETDWYSIEVTHKVKIGQQENLSRTMYPCFDDEEEAIDWFYRVHPDGIISHKK